MNHKIIKITQSLKNIFSRFIALNKLMFEDAIKDDNKFAEWRGYYPNNWFK